MWKPDVGVPECYIYRSGEASKQFDKRAAEILQSRTRAARGTPGSPLASPLPDLVPLPSFSPSSLPVLHSPVVRGLAADPARNVHNNDALPDATRVPRALYLQNSRSEPQLRMPLIGCVGDAMIQERQRSRRKKEDPEPLPGIVECRMNLDAFRRAAASSAVVVAGCIQDPIARTIAMRIARAGGVGGVSHRMAGQKRRGRGKGSSASHAGLLLGLGGGPPALEPLPGIVECRQRLADFQAAAFAVNQSSGVGRMKALDERGPRL
mmetsp:Transcript_43317/g.139189  ORF Transcript_43317/g.139189 Transcript_43317/m.139189 type:complete len:265 (-) Transcript_43317:16-810(-)